ncbi:MAG: FkbM family methyltransferase [Dehalococcoidia bacterium]|nr:MAG: FkbM family methyltransferase [Dehalococcoidia bacterium]
MNVVIIANKVLRTKGNLLNINFKVNGRSYRAFVPDDQLFGAIKDILLNREYEYLPEFELNRFKGKRVVDAGANVGLFSLLASTFAKEVISVEPHPVNFKLLQLNLDINDIQNVIPINKALWSENETLTLYAGEHTGAHTILKNAGNKKFNVSSTTLRDIIDEFGEIDLLKMDIEGGEFEVLSKLDSKIFRNIKNIVAECHLEAGGISQLEKVLKENFHVEKFTPPVVKKKASYPIEVKDLTNLRVFRKFVYALSTLVGTKVNTLAILFARREK